MTLRHDDNPTAELDGAALRELLANSTGIGYAADPYPVVLNDAAPRVIASRDDRTAEADEPLPPVGDEPRAATASSAEAIAAIDAAAAAVSIDLPIEDDGSHVGFVAEPVDPRFVERRNDVAHSRRRQRLRKLAAIAFAPVIGAGAVLAVYSPLLDVDRIDIIGSSTLSANELARISGLELGDPMLATKLGEVEEALAADPRFERVTVERKWPNAVSVRVSDRRVLAALDGPSRSVVIGEGGIVMRDTEPEDFIGRIQIAADVDTEVGDRLPDALAAAVEVVTRLPFEVGWNVASTVINDEGELVFTLTDDTVVVFGTVENADAKVQSVVTMLTSNVDRRGVCRIDVRVPSAPTVRRQPNCELPPRPRDLQAQALADAAAAAAAAPGTAATPGDSPSADGAEGAGEPLVAGAPPPTVAPKPEPEPNDGGIVAPPEPAGTANGANLEPGADGVG
ncbi:MAG: FtsQ-type POTRA domain-containing protein [Actinobacteria bacterium]|nr:FtsQ-type POTRA domain-containing protein [Actinomycetota bacterium]